jgi:hypothetical protein
MPNIKQPEYVRRREAQKKRLADKRFSLEKLSPILSLISMVLSIFSLVASVVLTSKALDISNRQLIAAHAQERAFVVVDRFEFTAMKSSDGEIKGWSAVPIFENMGDTPTKSLRYVSTPCFVPLCKFDSKIGVPVDPEFYYQMLRLNTGLSHLQRTIIGPKAAVRVVGGAGLPTTFEQKHPDTWHDYWIGSIHYRDVFQDSSSPDHVTKFCYSFYGPRNAQPNISPCGHWNCTDDECAADITDYEAEMADLAALEKGAKAPAAVRPAAGGSRKP